MARPNKTGVAASQFRVWPAAKQPTDIPRKQASSTVFVKNVKKRTWAGNHRMQASSRNRISQLITNKYAVDPNPDLFCGLGDWGMSLPTLIDPSPRNLLSLVSSGAYWRFWAVFQTIAHKIRTFSIPDSLHAGFAYLPRGSNGPFRRARND